MQNAHLQAAMLRLNQYLEVKGYAIVVHRKDY